MGIVPPTHRWSGRRTVFSVEMVAGAAGYQVVGTTVGKTAIGGNELVAIARRAKTP